MKCNLDIELYWKIVNASGHKESRFQLLKNCIYICRAINDKWLKVE